MWINKKRIKEIEDSISFCKNNIKLIYDNIYVQREDIYQIKNNNIKSICRTNKLKRIIINKKDINNNNLLNYVLMSDIIKNDLIYIIQNNKIIGVILYTTIWHGILLNIDMKCEENIKLIIEWINERINNCEFYIVNR